MESTTYLNDFRTLSLEDKKTLTGYFKADPPEISELTFTNLFMWRHYYRPVWRESHGCLQIVLSPADLAPFGLPPAGLGDKSSALDDLCRRLAAAGFPPRVSRAGQNFVDVFVDPRRYEVSLVPGHCDYVYLTEDLINLSGRKFHQKKNHLNSFINQYEFECRSMDVELVECVLDMQEAWCQIKNCAQDPNLLNEDRAVFEALKHFEYLDYQGLAIIIEAKVEAFALGEPLNPNTAVIHVEKANPKIRGLYAAVNQRFCRDVWAEFEFINREQDLGQEGLRRAKQSYHPHHLVKKYDLLLKSV